MAIVFKNHLRACLQAAIAEREAERRRAAAMEEKVTALATELENTTNQVCFQNSGIAYRTSAIVLAREETANSTEKMPRIKSLLAGLCFCMQTIDAEERLAAMASEVNALRSQLQVRVLSPNTRHSV